MVPGSRAPGARRWADSDSSKTESDSESQIRYDSNSKHPVPTGPACRGRQPEPGLLAEVGHWHGRQSASESRRWYSVPVILNSQAHCVTATRCRATHRDSDWQSETAEVSPSPSQECFATGSLSGPGHGHPAVRRQCRGTIPVAVVTITGRHSDFDISQSQVFDFRWYLLFNMYKSSQENV